MKYQNDRRKNEAEEKRKQHEEKQKETLKNNEQIMQRKLDVYIRISGSE